MSPIFRLGHVFGEAAGGVLAVAWALPEPGPPQACRAEQLSAPRQARNRAEAGPAATAMLLVSAPKLSVQQLEVPDTCIGPGIRTALRKLEAAHRRNAGRLGPRSILRDHDPSPG